MVENQKSPEIKKEVSKPNGAELPHITEVRKLDGAAKQVQDIKRKQEIAKGSKLQEGEKEDAGKMLLEGFNSEPGKLTVSQKPKENFVESSEVKNIKELNAAKDTYQEQLKKTYETHIGELKDKPEEQKKVGQEYLGRCVKDLGISSEKLGKNDVKTLAETLPKAWKETILDPKSVEKNPELKEVRDAILVECMKCPGGVQNAEKFLKHCQEVTGINDLTLQDIQKLSENQQKKFNDTEEKESVRKPGETDEEFSERTVDSAAQNGTGEATIGEAITSGNSAGYSSETGKEASENSKMTAQKIKESFKDKPELHPFIDRHASNNPNFSFNKPFLLQDITKQRAYIYFPGGETLECSATHGAKGVGNADNSHGTSLGSKELVPDSNDDRGNKIKIRTAVKGLESCNSNDFARDIRIHEQHGARTWGCTGLPNDIMQKFDAAIDSAGGGAQEIFLG